MDNNFAITIGRSFGSGGRVLGRLVAERLGIPFYDKQIGRASCRERVCQYV